WILPSSDMEPEQSASQMKCRGRVAIAPPGRFSERSMRSSPETRKFDLICRLLVRVQLREHAAQLLRLRDQAGANGRNQPDQGVPNLIIQRLAHLVTCLGPSPQCLWKLRGRFRL